LLTRRRPTDFRDCPHRFSSKRSVPATSEPVMHTFYDDIATALVTFTFAIASVSAVLVTLTTI